MTGRTMQLQPWQAEELRAFADGEPHDVPSSANLIRRGMVERVGPGTAESRYVLTSFGRAALASYDDRRDEGFAIEHDDLWPRDEQHRYRVYGRIGDDLTVLFACPDPGGIGQGIVQLHADAKLCDPPRRLADHGRIGVLDVLGGENGRGEWIVLPFDRGGPA